MYKAALPHHCSKIVSKCAKSSKAPASPCHCVRKVGWVADQDSSTLVF